VERWLIALAPLLGLCANTLVQPLVQHLTGRGRPARSLALGFLAGLVTSGALVGWAVRAQGLELLDAGALLVLQLLCFAALGYGYFAFVNLNLASIRIRILKEVTGAGDGGLPQSALDELYDEDTMAEGRLERLVAGGHLLERDGRHHRGKATLLQIAGVIEALKWAILGRGSKLNSGGPSEAPSPSQVKSSGAPPTGSGRLGTEPAQDGGPPA